MKETLDCFTDDETTRARMIEAATCAYLNAPDSEVFCESEKELVRAYWFGRAPLPDELEALADLTRRHPQTCAKWASKLGVAIYKGSRPPNSLREPVETVKRKCLKCRRPFEAETRFIRRCGRCKSHVSEALGNDMTLAV